MNIIHQELKAEIEQPKTFLYEGEFRGVLRDANGNIVHDSGWVKNSFTTYGLENRSDIINYVYLGSGTLPTNIADTELGNYLDHKSGSTIEYYPISPGGPYKFGAMLRALFNPGEVIGNVNEIGLGSKNSSVGPYLYCREVFPSTIVVGADNSLEVFYRIYCTVNTTNTVGEVVINGITYDYIMRPIDVLDYKNPFQPISIRTGTSLGTCKEEPLVGLEDVTPGGSSLEYMSRSAQSYSGQSMDWSMTAFLDAGNFATGVKSAYSRLTFITTSGDGCGYGAQFTAKDGPNIGFGILKTDLQYLTLNFRMSWGQP